MSDRTDVLIIGGGIVGLAAAYQLLQRRPDTRLVVLEKEDSLGYHQTAHNSGVLHSGIYYKPGSLKAVNCREGKKAMEAFCAEHGIAYDICGKVIVAVDDHEVPALQRIYERGQANGVKCEIIDRPRLKELEPHAAGVQAIHVPETGIVDYKQVCDKLGELIAQRGGRVRLGARVVSIGGNGGASVVATADGDAYEAKSVVNCGGLQSDRLTAKSGIQPEAKIVPFRGEYYELVEDRQHLCRNLIYPVPDPSFPFLGVHFTRMIHGGVECGPNAVLALAREGYGKLDVDLGDMMESLTYAGFLRLAIKHWRMGAGEMWRSLSKKAFVKALQRLMPEVQADDLVPAVSGIRAQAVTREGGLVDDFLIAKADGVINVQNAPSPAATASLNIGNTIVDHLGE